MRLPFDLAGPLPWDAAVRYVGQVAFPRQDAAGRTKRVVMQMRRRGEWVPGADIPTAREFFEWAVQQRPWRAALERVEGMPRPVRIEPRAGRVLARGHRPLVAVVPSTAEALREAYLEALQECERLRAVIACLEPDARRWREFHAGQRATGARGGRGNTR